MTVELLDPPTELSQQQVDHNAWYATASDFYNETVAENPYIPKIEPPPSVDIRPGPYDQQIVFLCLPTQESLYGGAAGGGKSAALLMGALQYVMNPGYNGLLLRKTFSDLSKPDALITLSHQWLRGTDAHWNGGKHEWLFPSGATLTFGFCDAENDKYNYQGAQYQYIGFDELTQFSETQYTYLISRLRRRTGLDILLRARAASNPGGLGHEWVKQRFVVEEGADRPFIPAKLSDNVYLDRASYEVSLDLLDLVTRNQLKHGDWNIRPEGNMFKREWFTTILDREPNDVLRWVRHWDLAATEVKPGKDPDFACGCKLGLRMGGTYVLSDMRRMRGTPQNVESMVKGTALIDGRAVEISIEEEGGASGKMIVDYYQRVPLLGYGVTGIRPTGDKVTRAQPFSAACEQGRVAVVRGTWLNTYMDELCAFPMVDHDDQVDASTGAFNKIAQAVISGELITVTGQRRTF